MCRRHVPITHMFGILKPKKSETADKPSIKFDNDAPLNPETNPPDSLDELDALIALLQNKSIDIKHQLEVAELRMARGLSVNYDRIQKASYARKRTNQSITALQQIAKQKRLTLYTSNGNHFAVTFVRVAQSVLSADVYMDITTRTQSAVLQETTRLAELNATGAPSTPSGNAAHNGDEI